MPDTPHPPSDFSPPHRVLVVNDNAAARYATCRALQAGGFETVDAPSGAQALELAAGGVAAVVLDVHLPDLHGFEVCRLIRRSPGMAGVPVIHVSAVQLGSADMIKGLSAGADAYLISPVEPPVLVAYLQALIRARASGPELRHSEQRLRGIFENAGCAMALVDDKGRIAEANAALARILGLGTRGLVGRAVAGLVPREWKEKIEQLAPSWGAAAWRGQFPVIDQQGGRIELDWSFSPHPEPGYSVAVIAPAPQRRPGA